MEVLDIVQSAAFKSGVIPSFNPDELPGDVLAAGREVLVSQILPAINCDRTLDITMTSRVYKPVNNTIILQPLLQPNENCEIIGHSTYPAEKLIGPHVWGEEVRRLRQDWTYSPVNGPAIAVNTTNWPTDDFNTRRTAMIWSSDNALIYANTIAYNAPAWQASIMPNVNIDFPPMRVDKILDTSSGLVYEYLYRDEFEEARHFKTHDYFYTVEEHEDKLIILFDKCVNTPKTLVMPIPLQIINRDHSHSGTIVAPQKFQRYLTDATAVSLAIIYGMSTLPAMQKEAEVSYNLLKKNLTQPYHKANIAQEINDKLRSNLFGISHRRGF